MPEKNAPRDTTTATPAGDDIGQAEVQSKVDEENEKGYRGETPDPIDDAAYTVDGVLHSDKAAKQDRGQGEPLTVSSDKSFPGGPRPAVGGN